MGKSHDELEAENARLTKRLGEAEGLLVHAPHSSREWKWSQLRDAYFAASSAPPPADSPVLSTPIPIDPPLPGLSREDAAIARERINPTPRWPADTPLAAAECNECEEEVTGEGNDIVVVCLHCKAKHCHECGTAHAPVCPAKSPVAPGPLDVEARLEGSLINRVAETRGYAASRLDAIDNRLDGSFATARQRMDHAANRIDELAAKVMALEQRQESDAALLLHLGNTGALHADVLRLEARIEKAAPPAPVAEPGTCTEITCRYYGQRHATAHEPRDVEAAEAGHAFVCVTKDPQGRDCTSWCRCECGEYKGAPIHAMAKSSK